MTDIEEIRARHEAAAAEGRFNTVGYISSDHYNQANADRAVLLARVAELEAALSKIAHPQATFAGPECCKHTFSDACELFADIAAQALKEAP